MTTMILSQTAAAPPDGQFNIRRAIAIVLTVWFLGVVALGAAGAFVGRPGTPPFQIGIAVAMPLAIFFACLRFSQSFREFAHSLDLRLITGIQAWRWAGLGFLSLYAHGILPGVFAFPAGLGDMAVGFAAPWMVLSLVRQPGFAAGPTFVRWNILGMLDLVIALGIGTASAFFTTGSPGEISTAPLATLPLLLIPAFLVPIFLMLHTSALIQSRHLTRTGLVRSDQSVL